MAVLAVGVAVLTSYLTERVAFRPVRSKSLTAMLITSFAVSTLLQNAALLLISPRARAVRLPDVFSQSVVILGSSVPLRNLMAIGTSIAVLLLLSLVLRRTVLGIALRAASDNFRMTRNAGSAGQPRDLGGLRDKRPLGGHSGPCSGWAARPP